MKIIFTITLLMITLFSFSQTAGDPANFDIRGNITSGTPTNNADDWIQGNSGFGVIDTSQAALFRTLTQNLSNQTFTVGANHEQFEYLNNSLQYQSKFARDYVNMNSTITGRLDSTVFIGGNKNAQNPQTTWGYQTSTVLSKNDLVDSYIHLRRAGSSSSDSMWLMLGQSMLGFNGDHFIDFELIASDIELTSTGTFINSGNQEGKNEWIFDSQGNLVKSGDMIIGFAFSGSTVSDIEVRIWVSRNFYNNGTPSGFTFGPEFDGDGNNSTYGYAQVLLPSGSFYGIGSTTTVTAPPWGTYDESSSLLTSNYGPGYLAEVGVNLTAVGIDPSVSGGNACDAPFVKVMAKSRSSASFTSQLKDFTGPFEFLGTPIISASFTPDTFNCINRVIELKPDTLASIAYYTWSTLDGNFVSSNTDTSHVFIDQPGTYILCAAPVEGCNLNCDTVIVIANPCAENDINNTNINTAVSGNITINDFAPPGSDFTLSTSLITTPSNGSFTFNADGSYTYQPTNGFVGTDSLEYEICITDYTPPTCNTAWLYIEVRDNTYFENEQPVANNDNATTNVNTSISSCLVCNDSDPDQDSLFVNTTPVNGPNNGTLTINADGTYTYIPNTDFTGIDQFTYEVCDNGNPQKCDVATVFITITKENPKNETYAFDDAYSMLENNSVSGDVSLNDTDPEGNSISGNITLVSGVSNGTLTLNTDGTFSYTPNDNYTGPDQFVYSACDDGTPSACDTATVYLDVFPLEPIAYNDINQTTMNIDVNGDVLTNDTDGDNDILTVNTTPITNPSNGSIILNADGSYTYSPNSGFTGTDSIAYQICDETTPNNLCDTAWIIIEVRNDTCDKNEAPIAQDDQIATPVNQSVSSCLICNDSDSDMDSVFVNTTPVNGPNNGSLIINSDGTYTYTPNNDFTGFDHFTYQICDNGTTSLCDLASVTISIYPKNYINETFAFDDAYSTIDNISISSNITLNDYDPEGDLTTGNITLVSGASNGTLVLNIDGTFSYTANANYVGPDQFVYSACDDGTPSACDTATVYLTINNFPHIVANDDDASATPTIGYFGGTPINNVLGNDSLYCDNVNINDVSITVITPSSNPGISLNTTSGQVDVASGTPAGTYTIDYQICESLNPTNCDSATITVVVVNNPPVAVDNINQTVQDSIVSGNVLMNDTDPDGEPLNVTPASGLTTSGGSYTINKQGIYVYTPPAAFTGTDTFTYEVCDNGTPALCDTAIVTITVIPCIIPPDQPDQINK